MHEKVFMGIDGGGTYIRVAIADEEGNILSHVKWQGGACGRRNPNAKDNMYHAIMSAVGQAKCDLEDVCAIGAGIAGYDSEEDAKWVSELTNIPGLACPKKHVNDAVVAHVGVWFGKPGILAISGSGSSVYGITEKGKHIRNYDFNFKPKSGAKNITYSLIECVLAGKVDETDDEIVQELLTHFNVKSILDLAYLEQINFEKTENEKIELYGSFAPKITDAAMCNSNLAKIVCDQAAMKISTGIKMIGDCFEEDTVKFALTGSVANSTYIKQKIVQSLSNDRDKFYILSEPVLQPELGAIIIAMQEKDISVDERIINNLNSGINAM